ncbi:MAG: hypothetical protein KAU62_00570, partial [Candidatus Heimdallarchaeota archaeon]|nr:hypothetical protein [Candidatus Heimdallarchaeota archaeon]
DAKEASLRFENLYYKIDSYLTSLEASNEPISEMIEAMRVNNNPRSTKGCMDYLRSLTDPSRITYVYRGTSLNGKHPFNEAQFEIWAPEEDTSIYYGKYYPPSENLYFSRKVKSDGTMSGEIKVVPPHGVDAGDFYNLVEMRQRVYENMLTIDKAKNNTSVVFCLTWRGIRILFTGDAEERSWKTMRDFSEDYHFLQPVHFLKISHHGSKNGTPEEEILNEFFPEKPFTDGIQRFALLSTRNCTYNQVPSDPTLAKIRNRCNVLYDLRDKQPGEYEDIKYQA